MTTLVNVGDVLAGKYRVEKVLGVGGMGMVVAAMHLELEERVALKFMLPDAMRSAQAVDRFLREAKASVKLRSEHVCRVLDVGKLANGAPYIVMEFMAGQDFAELISQRGVLSVPEAVEYLLQAIEGVAEAHANRIVHRDLKPANLFVTTDSDGSPLVKVLDFGISKSSIAGGATKTGDIMGSPSYMAPEQMISSKDVDGRADVWALGVILYQAVTGRLPFEAESLPVLCMAVMHDEPRALTEFRKDLPPAFSEVVMRCLEKRIDQRIPDVAALATALAPFGGPEAAATALRLTKMRNRASAPTLAQADRVAPVLAPTLMPPGAAVPMLPPTETNTADSQPVPGFGRISTLQSSAGSLEGSLSSAPRNARRLITGITAAVVAGVVLFLVARESGGSDPPTAGRPVMPATQPQPTIVQPVSAPANEASASPAIAGPAGPAPADIANPASRSSQAPSVAPTKPSTEVRAVNSKHRSETVKRTTRTPVNSGPPTPKSTMPKTSSPSCDPPYVVGGDGKRTYKLECL